jgi:pimeloyl-ACP methyl ester carboxylesterase
MALYSSMASKKTMQLRDGRVLSYCLVGHDLQQQQHIDANSSSSSLAKVPTPTVSPAALQPIKPAATVTPVATVVYHHGWPSSAAEAGVWHTAASELAVQMVAVDRPGIGGSTFDPKGEQVG